jgi:hypothetical protein
MGLIAMSEKKFIIRKLVLTYAITSFLFLYNINRSKFFNFVFSRIISHIIKCKHINIIESQLKSGVTF